MQPVLTAVLAAMVNHAAPGGTDAVAPVQTAAPEGVVFGPRGSGEVRIITAAVQ
jgi:hypothetical protein